jgi:hypothetical protein
MRKLLISVLFTFLVGLTFSQVSSMYQKGLTAEQNLKAIFNLTSYTSGGAGYDTRYEGIKGSTRLFDTLLTSFLKIKGEKDYMELKTDIDPVTNSLLFKHPKTGKLVGIPSDIVTEVVMKNEGKDLIFRTAEGKYFDKGAKGQKFFQVLKEEPYMFIKVPGKTFIQADYKGAYTSNKRYDEYETTYKYYIYFPDSSYHKILLNKKSLIKLFPDKKEIINKLSNDKSYADDEEMIKLILEKL